MPSRARRLPLRQWHRMACRALLALCLWSTWAGAQEVIVSAEFADPTARYGHGVLGDTIEHGTLVFTFEDGSERRFVLPETSVFEDTSPRLADVTGNGSPEVIVVESNQIEGARLVVYEAQGILVKTPYIGTRFRWLAPLGAADLDGDGAVELAYIDRPHLAKTLRIWRYNDGEINEIATMPGLTNHRISERDIAGGIRDCGDGYEMILASANWSKLVAISFDGDRFTSTQIGTDTSRAGFAQAMSCTAS